MPQELNLLFKNSQQVTIHFAQFSPVTVDFAIPLTAQDREAIRHYLEVYAAQYVMDIDDKEAERVSAQLPQWGKSLFDAVFNNASAKQLFSQFINTPRDKYLLTMAKQLFSQFFNTPRDKYLLTITAQQPEILSLPWELLHDTGQFLFTHQPSITILRRIPPKITFPTYASKSQLHILFVISRPQGESFINPRTDAQVVLKAIENYPAITVEFLQPASLENLWQRLQHSDLPRVDVIHFDGHGVFDKTAGLERQSIEQLSSFPRNLRKQLRNLKIGANSGYLLFEKEGKPGENGRYAFYVPTSWLAYLLSKSKIRLMVLSACQSAMVAHDDEETDEEPIGSIAVGLVASSVPSVLAMSYSVMVRATELLFGGFYREIAEGKSVGMALDKARHSLLQERKRRDLQRGQERVEIEVSDWFLPTLYQVGEDIPPVLRMTKKLPKAHQHNLEILPNAGFWGRSRELWQIENWFVEGVQRVVVNGFSGQGKTFLAQELGRWLLQKGMFDAVVFVDYSGYQGLDAVQWAVTTLGSVVEQNLVDVAAANAVLQNKRILLILDNLEVYVSDKQDTLQELLTVAHEWSLLGETGVLITTRPVDLGHEAYQKDSENFRQLKLEGLDKEDALHYFEQLLVLSDNPVRLQTDELLRWFAKVQFHPLSIGLLARSLETEDLANLESRLNQLMLELPDNPVEATLQLVIEQLDEESRRLLPRLGVFQAGAMEDVLLDITEIPTGEWAKLRPLLETTGLIQVETLSNNSVPYLQFHPNLTTALQSYNEDLRHRHQLRYYELSGYLYNEDFKNPLETRAIVKRELPNLLFAVKEMLTKATDYHESPNLLKKHFSEATDYHESPILFVLKENLAKIRDYEVNFVTCAVDFVSNMYWVLKTFGLQRDLVQLNQQAAKLAGEVGSQNWYSSKSGLGKQLLDAEHYTEAANIFNEILTVLGTTASYNRCSTLDNLGCCFFAQGQTELAVAYYQQGLETAQQLEPQNVQHQTGALYFGLANAFLSMGRYADAQAAYEQSLAIVTELNHDSQMVVVNGQLGYLALVQDQLDEAEQYYKNTLAISQRFHEPTLEAIAWHQLGWVHQKANQLEDAEHAYRQSANIKEAQGNLSSVARTWNNLAAVTQMMGKWADAEAWCRKAIEADKQFGNAQNEAIRLSNLAAILQNQPDRLPEAQQLAEQALAIKKTLDPATAEVWKTYHILEIISYKQDNAPEAKKYSGLAHEAKANFAGTRYELKQEHSDLILAVARGGNFIDRYQEYSDLSLAMDFAGRYQEDSDLILAQEDSDLSLAMVLDENIETALKRYDEDWKNLKTAIQQILAGERDVDKLCELLNYKESPIITAILEGIAQPESLKWFEDV